MTEPTSNTPAEKITAAPSITPQLGSGGLDAKDSPPEFSLSGSSKSGSSAVEEAPSPMDIASKDSSVQSSGNKVNQQDLINQVKKQVDSFNKLTTKASQLNNQNFTAELKQQWGELFKTHSTEALNSLNDISSRLNLPQSDTQTLISPKIKGFLNYLSGSQDQLKKIQGVLSNPSTKLDPGTLMAIQVKMNNVQQQIEFFSVALGKGLEDVKSIMNIQS
jgi:hypothetical protein